MREYDSGSIITYLPHASTSDISANSRSYLLFSLEYSDGSFFAFLYWDNSCSTL